MPAPAQSEVIFRRDAGGDAERAPSGPRALAQRQADPRLLQRRELQRVESHFEALFRHEKQLHHRLGELCGGELELGELLLLARPRVAPIHGEQVGEGEGDHLQRP